MLQCSIRASKGENAAENKEVESMRICFTAYSVQTKYQADSAFSTATLQKATLETSARSPANASRTLSTPNYY